jgi:HD-GYP domain-containing protein (c-di-GMP phosphodiesterase class II)
VNKVLSKSTGEDSSGEESSSDYFELPLEVFEKVSYLHIDTFTKIGESKYVKIISDTDKKPMDQFFHFKQKGIKQVYIARKDLGKYLLKAQEFLINKFSKSARVMDEIEIGDFIFEFSKVALDFVGVTEQVYGVVNDQIGKISKDVTANKNPGKLLKEAAEAKNYLSSHCVMTAYLSVFILQRLNLSEPSNFRKLIISSLFHDISLTDQNVSKISHVTDDMDSKTKKTVLNHMNLSCEFIEKIVKVGEEDIFNIIKQHHERPDGTGFPKGLSGKNIKPLPAIFIFAHEVVRFFFESNFNLPGLQYALSKMDDCWKEGNFEKPYNAILSSLEEHETN